MTTSANLPTTSNAVQLSFGAGTCAGVPCFDAFIARLSADGSTLQYSSYLGGSNRDWAQRVALASDGSAVLVGETASASFPTTSGAWQTASGDTTCAPGSRCTNAFITRIAPSAATSAQALRWSTRLGDVGGDSAWGVAIDGVGDVLVAGETESANLPLANAYDPSFGGLSDAFVAKLSGDGTTLHWGTYLSSTAADVGRDVAVDGASDVYVRAGPPRWASRRRRVRCNQGWWAQTMPSSRGSAVTARGCGGVPWSAAGTTTTAPVSRWQLTARAPW